MSFEAVVRACGCAVVALLLLATFAQADVVVLTNDNFDEKTATGIWMVEFYAPWCGHCKKLEPTWSEFATKVEGQINVAKVDCTVEKDLAQRFGIRGFPTIKLLRDGKQYLYKKPRTVEEFETFAREGYTSAEVQDMPKANQGGSAPAEKQSEEAPAQPAAEKKQEQQGSVRVLSDADFDATIATGKWLVKFYAPWCGHCKKLVPTWEQLAAKAEGFSVAKVDCTVHGALCQKFGVRGYPTLKLFVDGQKHDYSGPRTIESFTQFAQGGYEAAKTAKKAEPAKQAEPAAAPAGTDSKAVVLTTSTFDDALQQGDWLLEFYAPWCGHCKKLAPVWEELAQKAGNIKVGKIDCTIEKDLASRFEIRGYPTIKYVKDGQVYAYSGPRSIEGFLAFANEGYKGATGSALPAKK